MRIKISGRRVDRGVAHYYGYDPKTGDCIMFYDRVGSYNRLNPGFVKAHCDAADVTPLVGRLAFLLYAAPTHKDTNKEY